MCIRDRCIVVDCRECILNAIALIDSTCQCRVGTGRYDDMHFRTLRSLLAPSLLTCAAGCGTVAPPEVPDAMPDANPRVGAAPVNSKAAGTVAENGTMSLKD